MKKRLTCVRTSKSLYQLESDNCDELFVLYLLLTDSLRADSFIPFLEDKALNRIAGNMVNITKINENALVKANEDIFPDLPTLTISREGLILISKEYRRLQEIGVDLIKIMRNNDQFKIISG